MAASKCLCCPLLQGHKNKNGFLFSGEDMLRNMYKKGIQKDEGLLKSYGNTDISIKNYL